MIDHSDGPWVFRDPWTTTHPDHPVMDDVSKAVLDDAVVQLTLLRSPLMLGDALAELHAMVSLIAELHASLPPPSPRHATKITRGRTSPANIRSRRQPPDVATANPERQKQPTPT